MYVPYMDVILLARFLWRILANTPVYLCVRVCMCVHTDIDVNTHTYVFFILSLFTKVEV